MNHLFIVDNTKLKPQTKHSNENDSVSMDEDSTDMKAYINALSVSTNIVSAINDFIISVN